MKNKLPNDWKEVELKDVCLNSGQYGSGASAMEYSKDKPRYVRITDIDELGNLKKDSLVSPNKIENDYFLEEGDLLFARSVSVGKCYLHRKEKGDYQYAGYLIRFKPNKEIVLPEYLFFYTKTPQYWGWIKSRAESKKVTMSNINAKDYSSLNVLLPPLETQKQIVAILERAERLREKRKRANDLSAQYLKSVFYEMFGNLHKNSKKFSMVKLKEIADIVRNSILPQNILDNENYIGLEDIESETGRIIKINSVSNGDLKSNKFIFDYNFILYGKLRPYLNKITLPKFKGICSTDILPILPKRDKSNKYYLAFLLRDKYYINLATDRSVGANLPRLSPNELEDFDIPLPPIELQNKFSYFIIEFEKLKEKQRQSNEKINDLYNSLMQKAFVGEMIK